MTASALIADKSASSLRNNSARLDPLSSKATGHDSPVLQRAEEKARAGNLPFAGSLNPRDAWGLHLAGDALIVDVRTAEERKFVGYIPGTAHVAWMTGISLTRNPRFVKELESRVGRDANILLLCRSGKRSALAAEAAAKAGFQHVFNILEGFEGDLDNQQRRGEFNGWRHTGLPWVQD